MAVELDQKARARFWAKVDSSGECWVWTAALYSNGYGHFTAGGRNDRQDLLAHRVAYELAVGPIPEGLRVLHHCDNPACVRPDHLFLGTQADNVNDMREKGRAVYARGSRIGSAKLTENQVKEMRRRHAAGEGIRQLARHYGVSSTTVCHAVHGQIWRHVTKA